MDRKHASSNDPENKNGLLKVLGLWDSVALSVGIVIGVGIFRVPSEIARHLSSGWLILLAWLIGGAFSLLGAACYAELASSFPETGGDYVYLKKSYGGWAAFLYGWSGILVVRTGVIAAISFIFAEYFVSFFELPSSMVKTVAVLIILFLSLVNIIGLKEGKLLQNVSVIAKVFALVLIMFLGALSARGAFANFRSTFTPPQGENIINLMALALVPVLWTYGGWHENTFVTGETLDARRVLPKALLLSVGLITLLYMSMNAVYIYLIPVDKMKESPLIVSDIMSLLFGRSAKKALEALIMVSAFGALNGTIITSARINYAMGRDNRLFRFMGLVQKRFRSPAFSIGVNGFWSILLLLWGTFTRLLFFTGLLVWIFFAMIVAGVLVLRIKHPDMERPFKVWGYPITPVIFVLASLWLVANIIIHYPAESFLGIALTMTGIPVYLISKKLSRHKNRILPG